MPGMTDQTDKNQLDDEAIDWVVRLHSGDAAERDHAAFARWRAQSARHEAAAREAEDTWEDIGQTTTARIFTPDIETGRPTRVSRRAVLAAVAASVGGLTLASGVAGPTSGLLADYRTRRGERRREMLSDGSTLWLNTNTAVSLDFSSTERRLTLHAGEALFEVRKDAERPFIVVAGGGEAQALGTEYAVRATGAEASVTVVEGVVGVRCRTGDEVRRLTAGERTRYANGRFAADVESVDGDAATAWQRGKLIFNQRPLHEVVAELQRHRYGRLIVTDPALAATPVTGVFDLDDDAATFRLLGQALPLDIVRLPFVALLRRPPS